MDTYFITGATGMVGSELIPQLLSNSDSELILLTHERPYNIPSPRITLLKGDITKENLSLSSQEISNLQNRVTHIIHGAASTRFDLPWEAAELINCTGTKNVLDLAQTFKKLERCAFLSTLYVSGKRTGKILETELEHEAGFVNTYERSKYEAEKLLTDYYDKLPLSVYRLSTIIGNSKTGMVDHFTAPHQALRVMYLGLAAMLPGTPGYKVDMIASDTAAQTIFELFHNNFTPKTTYHIAGGNDSMTVKELIDQSYSTMGLIDPEWEDRHYPKPLIASQEAFDLFMDSAEATANPILKQVLGALNHFAHQLFYPKDFDQSNVLAPLPQYHKEMPDIRETYKKVIQYCLSTKWGRLK